jgi:hypothetical protein
MRKDKVEEMPGRQLEGNAKFVLSLSQLTA